MIHINDKKAKRIDRTLVEMANYIYWDAVTEYFTIERFTEEASVEAMIEKCLQRKGNMILLGKS